MPDQLPPIRWQPDRAPAGTPPADVPWPVPDLSVAVGRGLRSLCPACGQSHAFDGYLSVVPECPVCAAPLGRFRADDAPPYFTILIVGHLLVPLMFWVETSYHPALWIQAAVWIPAAALLCIAALRPIKGAVLGWMLKLGIMKTDD